jgi:diphthamide biosynthesis protein 3
VDGTWARCLAHLQAAGVPAGFKLPHATSSNQDAFSLRRPAHISTMADEDLNLYDEIEIEDCFYDETLQIYHHPCPCGDRFEISIADMRDGEDIARCPSCSLMIRIIFDEVCNHFLQTLFVFAGTNMASSV